MTAPEIDSHGVPDGENVFAFLADMSQRVQRGDREAIVRYSQELADEFQRVYHLPPPGTEEPRRLRPLAHGGAVLAAILAVVGATLIFLGGWTAVGPLGAGGGLLLGAIVLAVIVFLSDR